MSITKKDIDNAIKSFNNTVKCVEANCKETEEEIIRHHEIREKLEAKCSKHSKIKKLVKCMKHPEIEKDRKTKKACVKKHCGNKKKATEALEKKINTPLFKSFANVYKCSDKECKTLIDKSKKINDECHKKYKKDFSKAFNCKKNNKEYEQINKDIEKCEKTKCKSQIKDNDKLIKMTRKYNKVIFRTLNKKNKETKKIIDKHNRKTKKNPK